MDEYWRKHDAEVAAIKPMPRKEYLKRYPNGGPERFSGDAKSQSYRDFRAAIKRRNMEKRRPGWIRFWWALAGLAVIFAVVSFTMSVPHAIMLVLMLVLCYCFVEMGMNLPPR